MHESERGLVLRLRSVLAAPRARIFQALTTPADLAAWWGPEGFSTTEMDLDLRVGGRYRFTMRPPEGMPPTRDWNCTATAGPTRSTSWAGSCSRAPSSSGTEDGLPRGGPGVLSIFHR